MNKASEKRLHILYKKNILLLTDLICLTKCYFFFYIFQLRKQKYKYELLLLSLNQLVPLILLFKTALFDR